MRILIVEDNIELAAWLGRTLRKENYTVDCIDNGIDADFALRSEKYNLVILDLSLPGMDGNEVLRRLRVRKGMAYGLVSGAFIAGYTVVDGYAVKFILMSPILVDYIGSLARLSLLAPAVLRDPATARTMWKAQWKYAMFVGIISPVSYVLVLYAMQTAPLSHVAPAREVSMLFAALIGGQLLGEGDRLLRVLGAALIAAGVLALALG